MTYSDLELERLLVDLEADFVERKESLKGDAAAKVREAICAFANDLPDHQREGVIFVGARDDGTPVGLPITDELLRALADCKTDGNTLPPPTLVVEKRLLRGAEYAVVFVSPADAPPVRYRGRIWIRVGPRRAIATAQEERILSEKRRHRDRSFDAHPIRTAVLADLDRSRFEAEYLPAAFAPDVLEANERSYLERLAALKMIAGVDDPTPTVAGMLVLGTRPRDFVPCAFVQFLRFAGCDLAAPIRDEAAIDGPITDVLRRLEEKFAAHNMTTVDLTSGPTESRSSHYPLVALEQVARNAVLHRNYEGTNAPIRVTWFDDRIEIASPGGPYGAVSVGTFGRPGFVDYRNPVLAEAMKILGFVQRFGVGIATARAALRANGNPEPAFDVSEDWVVCTIFTHEARP